MTEHSTRPDTPEEVLDPSIWIPPAPRWWTWLVDALKRDPAHAFTLGYLMVSLVGIWSAFWFYRQLGVHILDYMGPADYLTAGLRDPVYILVVVLGFLWALLVTSPYRLLERDTKRYFELRARGPVYRLFLRDPRKQAWTQKLFRWRGMSIVGSTVLGVVVVGLAWTLSAAIKRAEDVKKGGGHPVRITLAGQENPLPQHARMLGTVGEFAFVYWPDSQRVEGIGLEHAARFESVKLNTTSLPPKKAP